MKHGQPQQQAIRRSDYQVPDFLVNDLSLTFNIDPQRTLVASRFEVFRNPVSTQVDSDLMLDGVDLELLLVRVDGERLNSDQYVIKDEQLCLSGIGDRAMVEIGVAIQPASNTALEGLYTSGDFLLTQCEPQGFRKITYFFDRPDVMCRYHVTLEAERNQYPLLLCNGNQTDSEMLDDNRQRISWHDPFPKPSYLFALVAGDLATVDGYFTTQSGREVLLRFVVEYGSEKQCTFALEALKNAMHWDEQRFGLEYDLDIYHVVVTHDFNMGAMENKSLNIFNSRYVLADQETATDADFQAIEAVIGHEYFHNWTGNRVTCRDWFQLTLKEGLTVFRDQEFSADMQSEAVERIKNVRGLRQRQFPEDAGPMSHPIRPDEYLEINNFYTATVYQKGAEVIRMYQTLLGREGFRRGLDLYFERHDGQAVTCDDFLAAMADANQTDLKQFARWYSQPSTPDVKVSMDYNTEQKACRLTIQQSLTNGTEQEALLIPIKMGLLDSQGAEMPLYCDALSEQGEGSAVVSLTAKQQVFEFTQLSEKPLPSLLREYSAPVKLGYDYTRAELARLMAADSDSFNRWDAAERLQMDVLLQMVVDKPRLEDTHVDSVFIDAMSSILNDGTLDPALTALSISPISDDYLAQQVEVVDVDAVYTACKGFSRGLSLHAEIRPILWERMQQAAELTRTWSLDGQSIGRRQLHNVLLSYLMQSPDEQLMDYCHTRYFAAHNMTDRLTCLRLLLDTQSDAGKEVLEDFSQRYGDNPLVMDKWFSIQAMRDCLPVDEVMALMEHSAFSMKNPNKVRAVIGVFAHANLTGFHALDGSGYHFIADQIIALNALNPQVAARLAGAFNRWRSFTSERQQAMHQQLERIAATEKLSPDVFEVIASALNKAS